jgi:1-acylglycerone phosphate reductase
VYATARSPERMEGLEALGCTLLRLDTTDAASVDAAVGAVLREDPGGVDVLVNCAGIATRGPVLVRCCARGPCGTGDC